MDTLDSEVLQKADQWLQAGHGVVLGTVVRTWGSAPRPVGAVVAIRDDGRIAGSVSGGCIEDDLIDKVRRNALGTSLPGRVQYGIDAQEANRFGLPCGGTLELVLERLTRDSQIDALLRALAGGRRMLRRLDMRTGAVSLSDTTSMTDLALDEAALTTAHGPRWRLLLIGAGQLTHFTAQMALALDYHVLVCDPREEYTDTWSIDAVTLLRTMPDDTVLACAPDPHTAIVALTHDPKLDDLALIEALRSPAFYVGAIGSRRTQDQRKERLREFGVTQEQLDRLYGPVGLKNGARTPPEIAVSILAELTAAKYGYRIPRPVPILDPRPQTA